MPFDAKVLTVSDSVAAGTREDRSGEVLVELLTERGFRVIGRATVADGASNVAGALLELAADFHGLVVTTGGTGFSPTDQTPEGTSRVLERHAPGLSEAMRAVSPLGRLSRGVAGTVGQALIINLPGSPNGARENFDAVSDVIEHILDLLGGGQPH
ncbi:MAG TPA: MogA/MoaB family molybdenum cofactor biosynthesis protein [Acidimicrobiales bacterium]|jgi:molybdenum cofactor synthesis domain-containing protein